MERDLSAFHFTPFNNQSTTTEEEIHEYQIPYPAHGMDIVVSLVRKPERGMIAWEIEDALKGRLRAKDKRFKSKVSSYLGDEVTTLT